MITLTVDPAFAAQVDVKALRVAAQTVLQQQEVWDTGDLTILITDDEQLQHLNRQFRQVDAPTDVLAFPASEVDPDTGRLYLGDIAISLPHAQAQAAAGGHSLREELQLLVVHGTLHLLGYDHTDEEEKAHMWAAQREALRALGCPLDPP